MFKLHLSTIEKLVIYGNGQKIMEKTRDFNKVATLKDGKPCDSYFSKILSINLEQEPKNARKENLNRTDNYYLPVKSEYSWERNKLALYIHVSEVCAENLGEFVAFEHDGEKDYLFAYKLNFKHGAEADIAHCERLTVPKTWTLPEGATWDSGRNHYSIIDPEKSLKKDNANLAHWWYEYETIYETFLQSEGYHKIEKDDARIEREKLATKIKEVLGRNSSISHYDVEKLLNVFDITLKEGGTK